MNTEEKTPETPNRIADHLLSARRVVICEEINQKMAKRVVAELLALASISDDPITLFINSQGGHVEAGDTIHDIVKFIKPTVKMIGTGWVA
ncbi:MAG: ATP-dependent Clp protease proteolytic subunit, partial [Pseudomonadota bacterium]